MTGLTGYDYAELAKSYESEPPRRYEMIGEPVLLPRSGCDREPDAVTGEPHDPADVSGEPLAQI